MVKKKVKKQNIVAKKKESPKWAFWAPRILMIIYIGMVSSFALDVFDSYSGLDLTMAFFMHLIPSIVLFIFLMIAWKWEEVGAYLFIALGVIFGFFFEAFNSFTGFSFLVLPIWVIGALFLVSSKLKE
jgi:hypothetical protein